MVNMNDVAKLAKVSRGTVSNYINNVRIKEESRIRVDEAIKELGYIPNVAAREFKTNKSSNVVFILPTVWNPFFSELTYQLQIKLKQKGMKLLLCNSQDDYRAELEYLEIAQQNKVFGIISISYSNIMPYLTSETPYVAIERYYNDDIPYVTSDNEGGGKMAVDELIKKGCQKLLHVTRQVDGNNALIARKKGFEEACKEEKVDYEIFSPKTSSAVFHKDITLFLKEAFEKGQYFDGIFCATDRYASYCQDALMDMGIGIPEDVQLIGFDGSRSYATEELKISTIRQPVEKIAEEAVNLLIAVVNKDKQKTSKVLPVTFLDLKTTKSN
ncbi:LacI family DNA-binding transcriptional regulator [Clostridium vincentii]|uniref:Ribose operon repressor n=1 Tax=Clostridium vincentii TaxID=52704 RepID=A0A2T0BEJ4_9CLOT|nr:LacI family DNA-binding transcriptional regulator [Clostridium vincentii]PRR82295.1 Ribose operon repressor [Clostridium vincentii]